MRLTEPNDVQVDDVTKPAALTVSEAEDRLKALLARFAAVVARDVPDADLPPEAA
jgi:hypothetical protein